MFRNSASLAPEAKRFGVSLACCALTLGCWGALLRRTERVSLIRCCARSKLPWGSGLTRSDRSSLVPLRAAWPSLLPLGVAVGCSKDGRDAGCGGGGFSGGCSGFSQVVSWLSGRRRRKLKAQIPEPLLRVPSAGRGREASSGQGAGVVALPDGATVLWRRGGAACALAAVFGSLWAFRGTQAVVVTTCHKLASPAREERVLAAHENHVGAGGGHFLGGAAVVSALQGDPTVTWGDRVAARGVVLGRHCSRPVPFPCPACLVNMCTCDESTLEVCSLNGKR